MFSYKQVRERHRNLERKKTSVQGSQILVLGFAVIIIIGTILLKLPIATEPGHSISWLDALFTAVSATTVTGLIVVSTEATYTTFGEIVILLLIQIGGVGFITLSVILFRVIGRRIGFYERTLISQSLGINTYQGVVKLALTVLRVILVIEFTGALIMFTQWVQIMDWQSAAYFSIFHAVSAYCNAGFDLFQSMDHPVLLFSRSNGIIIAVLGILIILGTLGITVSYDIIFWAGQRHVSLHTRLVLPFTLFLIAVGTIMVIIDEMAGHSPALSAMPLGQRWMLSLFSIISSRTAGLTLLPLSEIGEASQLIIFVWMFIGGAPASMAGGVGLSTVIVVLVTLASTVRGYDDVRILGRTLPTETIFKAAAVLTVSTILVVLVTFVLILRGEDASLFPIAFEVISAFSNTGYSLGITSHFDGIGRFILAFTMFWGRLGPLTLVVALAQKDRKSLVHYPEEKIIIG